MTNILIILKKIFFTSFFFLHPFVSFIIVKNINTFCNTLLLLILFTSRNLMLVYIIQSSPYFSKLHYLEDYQQNKNNHPIIKYSNEYLYNVFILTLLETLCYCYIIEIQLPSINFHIIEPCIFLFTRFIYDFTYDFCHYFIHYLLHNNTFLFYYIHRKHHLIIYTEAESLFNANPIDYILLQIIPSFIGIYFVKYCFSFLSQFTFLYLLYFNNFINIYGHTGKSINRKYHIFTYYLYYIDIQLQIDNNVEDHFIHHKFFNYNYTTKINVLDRIFKTYKQNNELNKITN